MSCDDHEIEMEVVDWITAVIQKEKDGDKSSHEWLKSGEVLLQLLNTIKPEAGLKANKKKMAFMMRENITMFLKALRSHWPSLKESDLFSTDDLYDAKNLPQVSRCIYSFGGVVQLDPSYDFPCLGVAQKAKTKDDNKRDIGLSAFDLNSGLASTMETHTTGHSKAFESEFGDKGIHESINLTSGLMIEQAKEMEQQNVQKEHVAWSTASSSVKDSFSSEKEEEECHLSTVQEDNSVPELEPESEVAFDVCSNFAAPLETPFDISECPSEIIDMQNPLHDQDSSSDESSDDEEYMKPPRLSLIEPPYHDNKRMSDSSSRESDRSTRVGSTPSHSPSPHVSGRLSNVSNSSATSIDLKKKWGSNLSIHTNVVKLGTDPRRGSATPTAW